MNLHSRLRVSNANGPGRRSVIWVQGCSLACQGCFNPQTHTFENGSEGGSVSELVDWVIENSVDGLTVSGGEPFQQLPEVMELCSKLRKMGLTTIVLTGYTKFQVLSRASMQDLRNAFDVVIAGPYLPSKHIASGLRGSDNKEYLFFSDAYSLRDFQMLPQAEIVIKQDGSLSVTGMNVPFLQ